MTNNDFCYVKYILVRRAESDVSTTKVQKTKSIRKSLFDIFSQTIAPVEVDPACYSFSTTRFSMECSRYMFLIIFLFFAYHAF